MQTQTLLKKINRLESALQELKTEFYLSSARKKTSSKYAQAALLRAAGQARETIWQKRYAKNVKTVS